MPSCEWPKIMMPCPISPRDTRGRVIKQKSSGIAKTASVERNLTSYLLVLSSFIDLSARTLFFFKELVSLADSLNKKVVGIAKARESKQNTPNYLCARAFMTYLCNYRPF